MRDMMKILMYEEKTDTIKSEKYKKDGPVAMNDVLAIRLGAYFQFYFHNIFQL